MTPFAAVLGDGFGSAFVPPKGSEVILFGTLGQKYNLFYASVFNEEFHQPDGLIDENNVGFKAPGNFSILAALLAKIQANNVQIIAAQLAKMTGQNVDVVAASLLKETAQTIEAIASGTHKIGGATVEVNGDTIKIQGGNVTVTGSSIKLHGRTVMTSGPPI